MIYIFRNVGFGATSCAERKQVLDVFWSELRDVSKPTSAVLCWGFTAALEGRSCWCEVMQCASNKNYLLKQSSLNDLISFYVLSRSEESLFSSTNDVPFGETLSAAFFILKPEVAPKGGLA